MGSLIPQTLEDMEVDGELQAHLAQLAKQGQAKMTREEQRQRERALNKLNVPSFGATCKVRVPHMPSYDAACKIQDQRVFPCALHTCTRWIQRLSLGTCRRANAGSPECGG
eukprot:364965-Chlamydomonas_euryale.AAC.16